MATQQYDGDTIEYREAHGMNEGNTLIDLEINHPVHGWMPYTLSNEEAEPDEARILYARVVADGDIEPWVAPEPEPDPVPTAISRRQFYTALFANSTLNETEYYAALRGDTPLPGPLQSIVDALPEGERPYAVGLLIAATDFERAHPMVAVFQAAQSLTDGQVDDFFRTAFTL